MEAKDDNLSDEVASFLSIPRPPGAAKEPTEDMVVKADAIYSLKTEEKLGFKRGMDKGRRGCVGISEATTMKLAT